LDDPLVSSTDDKEQTGSLDESLVSSTDDREKTGSSEKAVSIETTVILPTEDEMRAARKKAKKAKKNFDLAARRREKRRVEKLQKSLLSDQPTGNPGEIDVISTIEDFVPSVPTSLPALPEIVADLDTVNNIPDYNGTTFPDTCIEPADLDVSGGQVNSTNATPESTEVHPQSHTSPSEIEKESSLYSQQMNEHYVEYIRISNLPYTAPGETIVAFFENLIGPVRYFSMFLDENGMYTGKASLIFSNSGDAFKAMSRCRLGLQIQGRRIRMKLFGDGLELHPGDFILPSDLASEFSTSYYML
jgi:hypothetical protein